MKCLLKWSLFSRISEPQLVDSSTKGTAGNTKLLNVLKNNNGLLGESHKREKKYLCNKENEYINNDKHELN